MKIKALYKADLRFEDCPVFELEASSLDFVMVKDRDMRYSYHAVITDPNFIVFTGKGASFTEMSKRKLKGYIKQLKKEKPRL